MTTKCVNPACGKPFRYLRGGKLFLIDSPPDPLHPSDPDSMSGAGHVSEFFWLCEECCRTMRIMLDRNGDVVLAALGQPHSVLRGKPSSPATEVPNQLSKAGAA